jgi:hypothetical protein
MELTTNNSELQLQEWKPSEIGRGQSLAIISAQNGLSIRSQNEEEIKQVLRYVMILVGLRGNNLPTDEEKFVLISFIKSNFANQTVAEIKLAFEMAVAGKFQVDVKTYENFSCEYFARIMNAYLDYARAETRAIAKQEEPSKPKPCDRVLKAQSIETANMYAQEIWKAQKAKTEFKWIAGGLHILYDYLEEFDIHRLHLEGKQLIAEKYKHLKGEEFKVACKTQAYKEFIISLVDFESEIDNQGKIKPIEL